MVTVMCSVVPSQRLVSSVEDSGLSQYADCTKGLNIQITTMINVKSFQLSKVQESAVKQM